MKEPNLFESPWPMDVISTGRTVGQALGKIAFEILGEHAEIGLRMAANEFEQFPVLSIRTESGKEREMALTRPSGPTVSNYKYAELLSQDLKDLCKQMAGGTE